MDEMFDMMENGPQDSFNDRFNGLPQPPGGYDPLDPNSQPQGQGALTRPTEGILEALRQRMLPQPPPMDDSQIASDRPPMEGNFKTPSLILNENMDPSMEASPDIANKPTAEQLVQMMIHNSMRAPRFR